MESNNPRKKITIYGHRGASALAPENTLAAIAMAKEGGADGVEFDVKLTKDSKVVLLHDTSVDRTSNGSGLLRNLTFSQLSQLDMGSWKGDHYQRERAPLLAEVFDAFGADLNLNIEITNYTTRGDGLVEEIVKVIRAYGKSMDLLFSSFYTPNLERIRSLIPHARTGQLVLPGWAGWGNRMACANSALFAIHLHRSDLRKRFVTKASSRGKQINVWTVNTESDIQSAAFAMVDGIITDDPAYARKVLDGASLGL